MNRPDFGSIETEGPGGIKLACKAIVPGLSLGDLVAEFEKAEAGGHELSANPGDWPVTRGVLAVVEAVLDAIYKDGSSA